MPEGLSVLESPSSSVMDIEYDRVHSIPFYALRSWLLQENNPESWTKHDVDDGWLATSFLLKNVLKSTTQ